MAWRYRVGLSSTQRGYGVAWRRRRLAALEAADYQCQIRGPHCVGEATEVDHVSGIAAEPHHEYLRAACKPCHRQVTAEQAAQARRRKGADPPGRSATDWTADPPGRSDGTRW